MGKPNSLAELSKISSSPSVHGSKNHEISSPSHRKTCKRKQGHLEKVPVSPPKRQTPSLEGLHNEHVEFCKRLETALSYRDTHPEISLRKLGRKFHIDPKTIKKYQNDPTLPVPRKNESKLRLSDHMEQRLIGYALWLSDCGESFTRKEFVGLATRVAQESGALGSEESLPSCWLNRFLERRPIVSTRLAESLSLQRLRASTPEAQASFFNVLNASFTRNKICNPEVSTKSDFLAPVEVARKVSTFAERGYALCDGQLLGRERDFT